MRRKERIINLALASVFLVLSQCAVHFYPKPVSTEEKIQTNIAHSVDSFAAFLERNFIAYKSRSPKRQKVMIENYRFYADPKFKDPRNFYRSPPPIKDMKMELLEEGKDYELYLLSWKSLYEPVNPEFWKLYKNYKENWTAYAVYIKHKKPVECAMAIVHGWTGGDVTKKYNIRHNGLWRMFRLGFDVALLQQPYHGLREPKDSLFSGELFISAEVSRLNEAMCQAVTDLRSLVHWLRRDHKLVGIRGGSLGGVVTLATAVAEPKLDFAIALVPPSSWADIGTENKLVPYVIQGIWNSGIGLDEAKEVLYPASPANYQPAIPKEDILIIAGMGDNFVPPLQPILVWERWGKPQIYWYPGGHIVHFGKKKAEEVELEFIKRQLKKLEKSTS